MYKFRRIFWMDVKNLFTNPMWLAFAILFPIALILIVGFLTSGSYGNVITSYDYYGIAMMIYGFFNAATFSANSFLEERIKQPNMRIIYSPVRPFFIPLSKVMATTVYCTITYTAVCALLHFTVGVNFGGADTWAVFLIMLFSNFFFAALGVLVCCILKSENMTNSILSLLLTIFAVLGGVFFPVNGLGKAMSAVSLGSPAKWLITACFQIIYDKNFTLFMPVCIGLILLSAACVLLSGKLFKGEAYQ